MSFSIWFKFLLRSCQDVYTGMLLTFKNVTIFSSVGSHQSVLTYTSNLTEDIPQLSDQVIHLFLSASHSE